MISLHPLKQVMIHFLAHTKAGYIKSIYDTIADSIKGEIKILNKI